MNRLSNLVLVLSIDIILFPIYVVVLYLSNLNIVKISVPYNTVVISWTLFTGLFSIILLSILLSYALIKRKSINSKIKITALLCISVWIYIMVLDPIKIVQLVLD